jgi:hypothetical protein
MNTLACSKLGENKYTLLFFLGGFQGPKLSKFPRTPPKKKKPEAKNVKAEKRRRMYLSAPSFEHANVSIGDRYAI